MRVEILYDSSDGTVLGILYPPPEGERPPGLKAFFRAAEGQKNVALDVPAEFENLDRGRLHVAIRVDLETDTPRIVAANLVGIILVDRSRRYLIVPEM
jgi:hypothetical protein